jgi:hypothetical protein
MQRKEIAKFCMVFGFTLSFTSSVLWNFAPDHGNGRQIASENLDQYRHFINSEENDDQVILKMPYRFFRDDYRGINIRHSLHTDTIPFTASVNVAVEDSGFLECREASKERRDGKVSFVYRPFYDYHWRRGSCYRVDDFPQDKDYVDVEIEYRFPKKANDSNHDSVRSYLEKIKEGDMPTRTEWATTHYRMGNQGREWKLDENNFDKKEFQALLQPGDFLRMDVRRDWIDRKKFLKRHNRKGIRRLTLNKRQTKRLVFPKYPAYALLCFDEYDKNKLIFDSTKEYSLTILAPMDKAMSLNCMINFESGKTQKVRGFDFYLQSNQVEYDAAKAYMDKIDQNALGETMDFITTVMLQEKVREQERVHKYNEEQAVLVELRSNFPDEIERMTKTSGTAIRTYWSSEAIWVQSQRVRSWFLVTSGYKNFTFAVPFRYDDNIHGSEILNFSWRQKGFSGTKEDRETVKEANFKICPEKENEFKEKIAIHTGIKTLSDAENYVGFLKSMHKDECSQTHESLKFRRYRLQLCFEKESRDSGMASYKASHYQASYRYMKGYIKGRELIKSESSVPDSIIYSSLDFETAPEKFCANTTKEDFFFKRFSREDSFNEEELTKFGKLEELILNSIKNDEKGKEHHIFKFANCSVRVEPRDLRYFSHHTVALSLPFKSFYFYPDAKKLEEKQDNYAYKEFLKDLALFKNSIESGFCE